METLGLIVQTLGSNTSNSYVEVLYTFLFILFIKHYFQIEIKLTKRGEELFLTRKVKMFKVQQNNVKLYSNKSSDYTVTT